MARTERRAPRRAALAAAVAMSAIALAAPASGQSAAVDAPEFNRDVRPILAEHCFACHGPDAADRADRGTD